MRFSLKDRELPLLTTKKVAWKTCFRELQWFIRGSTNNKELQNQNIHIWDGNSTREFLDSRGLRKNEVNDLGPIYGHQWRHFNAEYNDSHSDYSGKGIDQLKNVIDDLHLFSFKTPIIYIQNKNLWCVFFSYLKHFLLNFQVSLIHWHTHE